MKKLRVPAPEDIRDTSVHPLFLGGVLSLVLAFTALLYFARFQDDPAQTSAGAGSGVESGAIAEEAASRAKRKQRLARFEAMSASEIQSHDWSPETARLVLEHGPRKAAEAVCEDSLEDRELADPIAEEMLETVRAQKEHAPWTCLIRSLLRDEPLSEPVRKETRSVWEQIEAFKGGGEIIASVLDEFRTSRDRPEDPEFYAWLRTCGLNFQYAAGAQCRRLLHQLSPAQGADLLLTAEKHLSSEYEEADLPVLIQGIGRVADEGQPETFRVLETEELPAYEIDLRQAAVFMLCRFVHSPEEGVAAPAAEQLAEVAEVGGRAYDRLLLERWRETCRIAFGGGKERTKKAPVPILAVWTGQADQRPDYTLGGAIERGVCEEKEDYPIWYCGSRAWAGDDGQSLQISLADFFIETRHMEFEGDEW